MSAKDKKKGALVPRLRFPEFGDAGEWEINHLGQICENLDNRRVPITENMRVRGVIPYYGASGIADYVDDFIFDEELLCISEDGANLIARTSPIAFSISGKSWVNNHAHVLKFDLQSRQKFVENYINFIKIEQFLTGMAQPKLNKAKLEVIPIPIPPAEEEQQRIADCLFSLDERITAETSKLDTLKDHKKGLLKQLFPAEGETLPRLRFPEFRDAGEWEEKIISDVCSISTGKSNTEDKNDDGNFPFYVRSPIIERSTKYLYDEEAILTVGDGVGTGKVYHYVKGKYDLHQRVYRLFRFLNIDGKFLFYLFSTFFYYRVSKMSAKNSVDSVRMDMIAKMPIFVPTLAEQQRITDCLSSIDELITAQTQKIDLLKEHKKGLMQQLFPVIDEAKA